CGSVFTAPENTNATVQKQLIRISATVIVPQISDAINALDRLREFPTSCFAVFVTNTNQQGGSVDNAFGYPVSKSQFFAATKAS
ncbi:Gp37 family protein, partial [Salmonella enterica subsp. enterica serovar Virginia]|nr:Gp37 family protein [Salmonella enterica subsp. enterica serovar Virginia]